MTLKILICIFLLLQGCLSGNPVQEKVAEAGKATQSLQRSVFVGWRPRPVAFLRPTAVVRPFGTYIPHRPFFRPTFGVLPVVRPYSVIRPIGVYRAPIIATGGIGFRRPILIR
jgi:hypothetical protein